jgi:hypothetical protein
MQEKQFNKNNLLAKISSQRHPFSTLQNLVIQILSSILSLHGVLDTSKGKKTWKYLHNDLSDKEKLILVKLEVNNLATLSL